MFVVVEIATSKPASSRSISRMSGFAASTSPTETPCTQMHGRSPARRATRSPSRSQSPARTRAFVAIFQRTKGEASKRSIK